MKKNYTKKQITEAIEYWENILNEDVKPIPTKRSDPILPGFDKYLNPIDVHETIEELGQKYMTDDPGSKSFLQNNIKSDRTRRLAIDVALALLRDAKTFLTGYNIPGIDKDKLIQDITKFMLTCIDKQDSYIKV